MIKIDLAVIELTRRCNLTCRHCFRGQAQNKIMDYELIDKFTSQVDKIESLCLGGGESLLALLVLEYLIDSLNKNNVKVYSWYIPTNGTLWNDKLFNIIYKLNELTNHFGEDELNKIEVSNSVYHEESINQLDLYNQYFENRQKILMLKNSSERKKLDYHYKLVKQGRAIENNLPLKQINEKILLDYYSFEKDNKEISCRDMFYLSLNGYIYGSCDLSYSTMDNNKVHKLDNLEELFTKLTEVEYVNNI